jgi:hypothetical protein
MDRLKQGAEWLESQRRAHASTEVVYTRVSASATVPATIGRSTFQLDDGTGVITQVESRDYIVAVEDLVLDGEAIEPAPGDQIIEGDLDDGVKYEVMAIGGEGCWRWANHLRTAYRIHTKQAAD